jgi:hypothetical protein
LKKLISLLLVISLFSVTTFSAELEYTALYVGSNKAYVNDVEKQIDEDNPAVEVFVENDRSYVPVRFISESYQGSVEWVQETQTVNITFTDRTISLTIGKPEIIINGETKALDVAPIIREGRTFLPLRACTEAIGKEVFYSKGLILISDIPDILHETWDADIVDMLIENYFK